MKLKAKVVPTRFVAREIHGPRQAVIDAHLDPGGVVVCYEYADPQPGFGSSDAQNLAAACPSRRCTLSDGSEWIIFKKENP